MANVDKDIVFVRTEMGQKEAYDPSSDLPRVLRTLLFSIDGRSTAGSYAELLPNFGDVLGHLALLQEGGYIRVSKSRSRRMRGATDTTAGAGDSLPTEMRTTQFEVSTPPRTVQPDSRWQVSRAPSLAGAAVSAGLASSATPPPTTGIGGFLRQALRLRPREVAGPRAWGHSQQFATSVMSELPALPLQPPAALQQAPPPAAPPPALLSEAARLQAARDLMIDYLHLYLPAIAQEASMSIEALHSHEQMMRSLPDYSQLVSRTGDAGAAHLAQLHLTLGLVG